MKTIAKNKFALTTAATAVVAIAAIAASTFAIGFAAWRTELTAQGSVTANGKWDVKVSDASLTTSSGAYTIEEVTTFDRTGEKDDTLLASTISSSTWVNDGALMGTQSNEAMSPYTNYYAIDTSKYSVDTLKAYTTADQMNGMRDDPSTLCLSDHLKMYYRYVNGQNDGSAAAASASAKAVMDGFVADTEKLLKSKFPSTYQNYTVAYISGLYSGTAKTWSKFCYSIAKFTTEQAAGGSNHASFTDTTVAYNQVNFTLPHAWAKYSISVTNNGTAAANLGETEISLTGDDTALKNRISPLLRWNPEKPPLLNLLSKRWVRMRLPSAERAAFMSSWCLTSPLLKRLLPPRSRFNENASQENQRADFVCWFSVNADGSQGGCG